MLLGDSQQVRSPPAPPARVVPSPLKGHLHADSQASAASLLPQPYRQAWFTVVVISNEALEPRSQAELPDSRPTGPTSSQAPPSSILLGQAAQSLQYRRTPRGPAPDPSDRSDRSPARPHSIPAGMPERELPPASFSIAPIVCAQALVRGVRFAIAKKPAIGEHLTSGGRRVELEFLARV